MLDEAGPTRHRPLDLEGAAAGRVYAEVELEAADSFQRLLGERPLFSGHVGDESSRQHLDSSDHQDGPDDNRLDVTTRFTARDVDGFQDHHLQPV